MSEFSRPLTLLTAMGTNSMLVLELLDFLSGNGRFKYGREAMQTRRLFQGSRVRRLVLFCTTVAAEHLENLRETMVAEYPDVEIEEVLLDCDDIECAKDDSRMRRMVYEKVAVYAGPQLVISSAGRKTITQRIIEAGLLYGCRGYLSITAPHKKEGVEGVRFMTQGFRVLWIPGRQFVEERRRDLVKDAIGDSFRSVYLFPRTALEALMNCSIGASRVQKEADISWLRRLPKADLHCHLGGCQDVRHMQELAGILLEDLEKAGVAVAQIRRRLESSLGVRLFSVGPENLRNVAGRKTGCHCLSRLDLLWKAADLGNPAEQAAGAALLVSAQDEQGLQVLCRDGRVNSQGRIAWPGRKDLASRGCNRLDWYMACGNLGGSTLLQSRRALILAAEQLINDSLEENVRYLEIRCSPGNYTRAGLLSMTGAMKSLLDAACNHPAVQEGKIRVNFLVMATRHRSPHLLERHVALALLYGDNNTGGCSRVCGFDLAGQEEDYEPVQFRDAFVPLHRACMNITIHAGEMADEESIWQAIYTLHARRIGHGLKLVNNRRMMDFVRDHGLAIEMCPSSNFQTNSFSDFLTGCGQEVYPLGEYLKHGIRVTVNTDNRYISDTTLSKEYLMAARMTSGGLSRWKILKLVKNGFKAAFLPKDEKDAMLKQIDREIFRILLEDAFPDGSYKEGK